MGLLVSVKSINISPSFLNWKMDLDTHQPHSFQVIYHMVSSSGVSWEGLTTKAHFLIYFFYKYSCYQISSSWILLATRNYKEYRKKSKIKALKMREIEDFKVFQKRKK